jgi:hypothetical protein
VGETLNPMLYPLDRFLSLQPSEASFFDQRMILLCSDENCRLTLRHRRTPATEESLDSFTQLSSGMPQVVTQRATCPRQAIGEITIQVDETEKVQKLRQLSHALSPACPIRSPGGAS